MPLMTCFNHVRCNCGNSTFKFPINLLHMHMPCVTCLLRAASKTCEPGKRNNLAQRYSNNSASKWSCRRNWKAAPFPLLYLSLTISWCHYYRALEMLVPYMLMSYILYLHRLGDGPRGGLSGCSSPASQA